MNRYVFIIESLQDEMDDDKFSDWDREFMESMVDRLDRLGEDRLESILSDNQKEQLDRIWAKF